MNRLDELSTVARQSIAPTLPAAGGYSAGLGEFLGLCLDKEPTMRPAARDLLKHEWLRPSPVSGGGSDAGGSASSRGSLRHDRTAGVGALERSRSSLKDDLLEMTNAIGGMSLAEQMRAAEGLRKD